jgi:quercetin dioxygenase-like cupin family protein
MRNKAIWIGIGVGLLAIGFAAGTRAAAKKEIVKIAAADLKFEPVPNSPLQHVGPFKGAKGMECQFHKFPKGFVAPLHTHTADVFAVVVAGKFGSNEEGQPEALLGPGSFQQIPGGLKHISKCGPDADCEIFICQPGAFDIKMVGEKAGAKPAKGEAPKGEAPKK